MFRLLTESLFVEEFTLTIPLFLYFLCLSERSTRKRHRQVQATSQRRSYASRTTRKENRKVNRTTLAAVVLALTPTKNPYGPTTALIKIRE